MSHSTTPMRTVRNLTWAATLAAGAGLIGLPTASAQVSAQVPAQSAQVAVQNVCHQASANTVLRGTYQLEGEGALPIELVLTLRDGTSSRLFQVTGLIAEGDHRFGVTGMAYCTGKANDTLALDVTMSGGFHDTPVDDELRRAWPAGKAPQRASSAGTSVVHAEVALASMQGWAQAMRTIVLTGQRVMGPKHVSAKLVFSPERAR
ncbi:hypothetical protein [Pandoraea sputorum]|uniref:Uncharacterized protein n=2 Tax=Pandoraea TaxID=93217 RepID=A0A239SKU9_9BURK|nr:hypothetical protein [Pandoraea sputorum]BET09169.1 hypothetical protein THI4931_02110 [Pandoraea sputorum]SNU86021.1 Uncharacterised protein [Pandoraea sputorum]VVE02165.1 hypothetical protein PSP20601_02195 [Pandoraea sputorum]